MTILKKTLIKLCKLIYSKTVSISENGTLKNIQVTDRQEKISRNEKEKKQAEDNKATDLASISQ